MGLCKQTFARGADALDFDIPELAKRAQSSTTEETNSETDDELTEEDLEMQAVSLHPLVLRGIHFID